MKIDRLNDYTIIADHGIYSIELFPYDFLYVTFYSRCMYMNFRVKDIAEKCTAYSTDFLKKEVDKLDTLIKNLSSVIDTSKYKEVVYITLRRYTGVRNIILNELMTRKEYLQELETRKVKEYGK